MNGMTVGWLAERNAHKFPEKEAVVMQGPDGRQETVTHAEFNERADRVANGLVARGIEQGDKVGVYIDRKSTRLNSSHSGESRMPSSA